MAESNYSGSSNYSGILNVNGDGGWNLQTRKNAGGGRRNFDNDDYWTVTINGYTWSGYWGYDFTSYSLATIASQSSHGNYPRPVLGQNVNASWSVNMYAIGTSSGSFSFWANGTASAPGQVPWVNATSVTSDSFTVNWGAPGNGGAAITNYDLHICRSAAHDPTGAAFYNWTGSTATSKSFTGQPRGTTFYASVRAQNGAGEGAWSDWYQFQLPHTVPDKPTAPALNSKTSTSVNVTITDPAYVGAGATDRQVDYSTTSDFSSNVTTVPSGYGFTFTIGSLPRNTPYYVRHRVKNAIGWSAWSDALAVTTSVDKPTAPTGYTPTDITSTTAYSGLPFVSDNGGSALAGLRIQGNTSASETGATTTTVTEYSPAFMQGLAVGATYYYRMAVLNSGEGAQWSDYGPWGSFTTVSNVPGPPGAPTISAIGNNQATATWTAPSNLYGATITGYTLRVSPQQSFATGASWNVGSGVLTRLMDGLQPGTKYYVQVWSNSNNGLGSYSSVTSFTTTGTAPSASSMWVRVGGVWRQGTLHLRVGGVWKAVTPWVRIGGVWRKL